MEKVAEALANMTLNIIKPKFIRKLLLVQLYTSILLSAALIEKKTLEVKTGKRNNVGQSNIRASGNNYFIFICFGQEDYKTVERGAATRGEKEHNQDMAWMQG